MADFRGVFGTPPMNNSVLASRGRFPDNGHMPTSIMFSTFVIAGMVNGLNSYLVNLRIRSTD